MPRIIEGNLNAEGRKVAIVASRFNDFITARLIEGALDALTRHGVKRCRSLARSRISPAAFKLDSPVLPVIAAISITRAWSSRCSTCVSVRSPITSLLTR